MVLNHDHHEILSTIITMKCTLSLLLLQPDVSGFEQAQPENISGKS